MLQDETCFLLAVDFDRENWHEVAEAFLETRNRLICEDVAQAMREGRSPVVLTERRNHLDRLAEMLAPEIRHLIILRGGMNRKELNAAMARLAAIPAGEARLLLATGRYIGEGFDDARLDTLFLTLPISWRGTIVQYAGRLHRLHDGKREVCIYDYADLNVPMLARMFDRRCRGYEAVGYVILLPASAIPGWPTDVPLPVDSKWKSDYAASVRRLVRDGVDKSLATLFVDAARPAPPDKEGADRPANTGAPGTLNLLMPHTEAGILTLVKEIQSDAQGLIQRLNLLAR